MIYEIFFTTRNTKETTKNTKSFHNTLVTFVKNFVIFVVLKRGSRFKSGFLNENSPKRIDKNFNE